MTLVELLSLLYEIRKALSYTRSILKAISTSVEASQPRCPFDLWRRLVDHGISRAKPTGRGYRGGIRKCKALHQHQNIQAEFARGSRDHFLILDKSFQEESGISEVEAIYIMDRERH